MADKRKITSATEILYRREYEGKPDRIAELEQTRREMAQQHDFRLIVGGVPDLTDDIANALFEAGCDDATFSMVDGNLCADFSRSAELMAEAIASAKRDIERAGVGANGIDVTGGNL